VPARVLVVNEEAGFQLS